MDLPLGNAGDEMLSAGVAGAEPCLDACLEDCLGGGGREREGKERGAIEEVEGVVAKECRNNNDACFLDKTGCKQGRMLDKRIYKKKIAACLVEKS